MCGIVGFIGKKPAAPLLLEGLAKLEYRGYDSAGIALIENGAVNIYKKKGRLAGLSEAIGGGADMPAHIGIGHTRWATHGEPSDVNSHPHKSAGGKFAVVHNGIIENFAELKSELQAEGVPFVSQTDTEVIPQLIEKYYTGDFMAAVRQAVSRLRGAYALGILCTDYPEEIIAVRNASPLILGLAEDGNFIASDIPAVLAHTRKIIHLDNNEFVHLTADKVEISDAQGNPAHHEIETVTWDVKAAEKGGYPHFMIKEILEQPTALAATISPRITADGDIQLDGIHMTPEMVKNFKRVMIVACGSAYHAGIVGKYVIEKLVRIPVEVDLASEFRYREPLVDDKTLTIIISQSGETADTLEALKQAKRCGARVLSIVNVVGSSIANESDDVLYTWAGPEIAVATTKGYTTQVAMLYLIAFYVANRLGRISNEQMREFLAEVDRIPENVTRVLEDNQEKLKALAEQYVDIQHAYYIGRNLDYAVSMEASLKLKEISYVHSEAYAAGELKHGTISLIENGTLVVGMVCCERLSDKTISNLIECKSRGAKLLILTTEDNQQAQAIADHVLLLPKMHEFFMPIMEIVPMQTFAYYVAVARGFDADKPRNLAKSVTVE